jgi:Flp pilus assembly pilin Flp
MGGVMKMLYFLHGKLRSFLELKKVSQQDGYALLEYCAGAAVVAIVLWAAMQALGASVSSLLGTISDWALARASEVSVGSAQ